MFNPLAAADAVKKELTSNPNLLGDWNKLADTDPNAVKQALIDLAAKHGIKMSEGQLKLALAAGKPFLGKLSQAVREQAEQLIKKLF